MQELDFQDMWFQQDGAICNTSRVAMDLLRGEFGEHFISRSGIRVNWHLRSRDLTPLGYFLWGYVKALVYTDKPNSIEIPAEMLERVCQNWTKRMDHLRRSHGQLLYEIIFKH